MYVDVAWHGETNMELWLTWNKNWMFMWHDTSSRSILHWRLSISLGWTKYLVSSTNARSSGINALSWLIETLFLFHQPLIIGHQWSDISFDQIKFFTKLTVWIIDHWKFVLVKKTLCQFCQPNHRPSNKSFGKYKT